MVAKGLYLVSLFAGIAAHLLYFHRYEYYRRLRVFVAATCAYTFGAPVILSRNFGLTILPSVITAASILLAFLLGAVGSTLVYRLFFNPLNRVPGPFAARLTDFYTALRIGKDLDQHQKLVVLHRKYGPIVRTGASRVSIVDPDFVEATYNQNSVALKGPWYDTHWPHPSLQQERDKATHDKRRKAWVPAFSDRALKEYETHITIFNSKFLARVAEFQGGRMNVSKWFNLYSFDIMGALAFGKNYGMLESGEKHAVLSLISEGVKTLGYTFPVWFTRLLMMVPGDPASMQKFGNFCSDELEETVKNNFYTDRDAKVSAGSVITSWLYKIYENEPDAARNQNFRQDAQLLIVAGSDTTAAALTWLFFYLAQSPEDVQKIRAELRPHVRGEWSDKDIRHCEHLNASINESLRLGKIGPTGLYRMTPPEGMRVGETFLPGNVEFNIAQWIIARNESCYGQAEQFIPERWYSKPELIKHKTANAPFAMGSFGCIGKNLSFMEMRTLTASILLQYDVSFAPGEDGSRIWNQSMEHFTMTLAPLDLVFTPAKH